MFNEIRRLYFYYRNYMFDNVCSIIYKIIFLYGILALLRNESISIFYVFLFFSFITTIISINGELEYEIRTQQFDGLRNNKVSVLSIYNKRYLSLCLFNALLFVVLIFAYSIVANIDFKLSNLGVRQIIALVINLFICLLMNMVVVSLTIRYKRISVMLNFVYYFILFYSGLVFPVKFFTYKNLIEYLSSLII